MAPLRQELGCLHAVVVKLLDLLIMTVHFHFFNFQDAGASEIKESASLVKARSSQTVFHRVESRREEEAV